MLKSDRYRLKLSRCTRRSATANEPAWSSLHRDAGALCADKDSLAGRCSNVPQAASTATGTRANFASCRETLADGDTGLSTAGHRFGQATGSGRANSARRGLFQRPSVTSLVWASLDMLTVLVAAVMAMRFRMATPPAARRLFDDPAASCVSRPLVWGALPALVLRWRWSSSRGRMGCMGRSRIAAGCMNSG